MSFPAPAQGERTAWRFTDGVAGHEAQSGALVEALGGIVPLRSFDVPVTSRRRAFVPLLAPRLAPGPELPDPDLLVGAGHATHAPLLAARRARGGRSVVLMRPTLFPLSLFDLCVVPAHDRVAPRANVLETTGVLCPPRRPGERDASHGLVLLGGPASPRPIRRRAPWDEALVERELLEVVASAPAIRWTLVPSRRTPGTLVARLAARLAGAEISRWEPGAPSVLPGLLATAGTAWVTDDSVSMVSEALSAGAAVGTLATGRTEGRVARGMGELAARGLVTTFEAWRAGKLPRPADPPLDEAARVASWIAKSWWGS